VIQFMKKLIITVVILGAMYSSAMYSSASQAGDVVETHQKNLIDSFEVVVAAVKRSSPIAKEEFHVVSERFKDQLFVQSLSTALTLSEVLIPGPPKEDTSYRRDMFLGEVRTRNLVLATDDIISWLSIMHSLNGILLTEASLDPSRETELTGLYLTQSRDLLILSQEFNAWITAVSYGR
jgi:hypothetical protein